jgi:phosphoribosylpyrophosphate synthetase
MGAAQVDLYITHTMPSAKEFYENLKENGIDNYYTANTLQLPWIREESIKR